MKGGRMGTREKGGEKKEVGEEGRGRDRKEDGGSRGGI